jgi:hypothetical protein
MDENEYPPENTRQANPDEPDEAERYMAITIDELMRSHERGVSIRDLLAQAFIAGREAGFTDGVSEARSILSR